MGRDRYRFGSPTAPHFLTLTVLQWLPLFAQPAHVETLFGALRHHQRQSGLVLYGYVVMENHCHLLAQASDLPKVLASVKSYTPKQIVNRLAERNSPAFPRWSVGTRWSTRPTTGTATTRQTSRDLRTRLAGGGARES